MDFNEEEKEKLSKIVKTIRGGSTNLIWTKYWYILISVCKWNVFTLLSIKMLRKFYRNWQFLKFDICKIDEQTFQSLSTVHFDICILLQSFMSRLITSSLVSSIFSTCSILFCFSFTLFLDLLCKWGIKVRELS